MDFSKSLKTLLKFFENFQSYWTIEKERKPFKVVAKLRAVRLKSGVRNFWPDPVRPLAVKSHIAVFVYFPVILKLCEYLQITYTLFVIKGK